MSFNPAQASHLLDQYFHQELLGKRYTQAVLSLEVPNTFSWSATAGQSASGAALKPESPFFIASIDKLFNATLALLLVERGQLDLDAAITDYLPNSKTQGLHVYQGQDLSANIRIRHLLTHTSGLADWFEDYPKQGISLAERVMQEGDCPLPIEALIAQVRDQLHPHFAPQDLANRRIRMRYSDTNFIILVEVIEAVTGQPLHEVHKQLLYEPLGLRSTYFFNQSQPLDTTPEAMMMQARGQPLTIPALIQSVKGIYSSTHDLMHFIRQLMGGKVFADPQTLTVMTQHWHRFGLPFDRAALRSPSWPIEYAMGMMRFLVPRVFSPLTPIPAVYGHTGSTGCWVFYCPKMNLTLAGSVEDAAAGAVPFRRVPDLIKLLLKAGL